MDRQLLALFYELGRHDPYGEADAATCQQQLGLDHTAFFEILDRLDDKGYLDNRARDGTLKLSPVGLRALGEE